MNNYLFDKDFLEQLDKDRHKEVYAKVLALTINELPIEQIEGRVTGGSINIDGTSAVRRSCNFTMVAKDVNIHDFYWGLNTKISLEIGLQNRIDNRYPDIVWFKQGRFVLTSFNTSLSTNNYTIQLSGKDKMCLLNGEVGGNLPSSIDFGTIDNYTKTYEEHIISSITNYQAGKYYTLNQFIPYRSFDSSKHKNSDSQNYYIINADGCYEALAVAAANPADINNYYYKIDLDDYTIYTDRYCKNLTFYEPVAYSQIEKIPIKTIIREALHTYGYEAYSNIIINDLEDMGLELLEYRGEKTLYLFYNVLTNEYSNMTIDENLSCYTFTEIDGKITANTTPIKISEIPQYNSLVENFNKNATQVVLRSNYVNTPRDEANIYTIAELNYGDTAGYRLTELTYAGELIASIGETLTSILDKIKNMLGDFEYFYDIDGHFIFQKKQTFVNTSWDTIIKPRNNSEDDTYVENAAYSSAASYNFTDNNLITAFQNTPDLSNLKNDYSIWGVRKSITGQEIPIHVRYAIDKKPIRYWNYDHTHLYIAASFTEIYTNIRETVINQKEAELAKAKKDLREKYPLPAGHPNSAGVLAGEHFPGPVPSELNISQEEWESRWWDVRAWAEYYQVLTNELPPGAMHLYCTEQIKYNIARYFPGSWSANSYGFLWDVYLEGNSALMLESYEHNAGAYYTKGAKSCYHTYQDFLDQANNNITSFIYNPIIPEAIYTDEIERLIEKTMLQYETNCDWREIIYQMAVDWYKHGQDEDFLYMIDKNNIFHEEEGDIHEYPGGITNYERYYPDMQGFWRQLYNKPLLDNDETVDEESLKVYNSEGGYYKEEAEYNQAGRLYKKTTTWIPYDEGSDGNKSEYNFTSDFYLPWDDDVYNDLDSNEKKLYEQSHNKEYPYWNKDVILAPEALNFWIDFLDDAGDLSQYSIPVIGDRTKAINDKDVTAIYFRETPSMIYINSEDFQQLDSKNAYTKVLLPDYMSNLFSISSQKKSGKDLIDEMLYSYSYCIENITITAIPVYYLEPNTRIFVKDENSNINGEYIIKSINIPLTYNGTMSVSAVKAVERLY